MDQGLWTKAILDLGEDFPSLDFYVACPMDLHVYDPLDRHVGLNYTTGDVELEIPNSTYEFRGNVTHVGIDLAMEGKYRVELRAWGSGNYTFVAMQSVGGALTRYLVESGNVTEGEVITYEFSTSDLQAILEFLPSEVKPRTPALANVTLMNSGNLNVTRVNVTHLLPEGYFRHVDHATVFLEVNGTTYMIYPKDVQVEAKGGVVKIYLNFSAGVRLIGPRGVETVYALEPGWILRLYYLIRPEGGMEPGSYDSTVVVEYLQEAPGIKSLRLSTASAEFVVRSRGWRP